jgi:hypothetical protein
MRFATQQRSEELPCGLKSQERLVASGTCTRLRPPGLYFSIHAPSPQRPWRCLKTQLGASLRKASIEKKARSVAVIGGRTDLAAPISSKLLESRA